MDEAKVEKNSMFLSLPCSVFLLVIGKKDRLIFVEEVSTLEKMARALTNTSK